MPASGSARRTSCRRSRIEARALDPGRRALYLTVERFTIQFVGALRDRSALDFKERLRSIDILLIDDMQFLTGKAVQQEFCHMLNRCSTAASRWWWRPTVRRPSSRGSTSGCARA